MQEINPDLLSKYLADECTGPEKLQMREWLEASEANRNYFNQMQRIWEEAGREKELTEPSLELAWQKVDRATSRSKTIPVYRQYYKIAASFLIFTLLGILIYFSAFYQEPLTAMTGENEKKEITLADGSRIWLNENSRLQYPQNFSENLREVKLQGEAFFEVVRKVDQPFLVRTGNSITKVLGTSFNIRESTEKSIEIDVVTGKVMFYNQQAETKSILLQAGEEGLLAASALVPQKGINNDPNFLSWHTGSLIFKNVALQEVISQLEKFYNKSLILENKALNTCFLTSSFEKRSIEEVLQTLQTIYGLRYQIKGNTIYLRDGGC